MRRALPGELEIVGDQHERGSQIPVQLHHQIDDRSAGRRVEVAGRLVGEEDLGADAESPSQCHPLLFAPGELSGIMVFPPTESDSIEQFASPRRGAGIPAELQRDLNVFLGGKRRYQLERLKDKAHLLGSDASSFVLIESPELLAIEIHRTPTRPIQPGQQSQQGCLPAARWAEDRKEPARVECERDILQDGEIVITGSVGSAELLALQHRGMHLE